MFVNQLGLGLLLVVGGWTASPASEAIAVSVDPRVELFATVFRLAGNSSYTQKISGYRHAEESAKYFAPFREHEAVRLARRLQSERGIGFDAVPSLAVHLEWPALTPRFALDPRPARLDRRWRPDEAKTFVAAVRDFSRVSDFAAFFAAREVLHKEVVRRLSQRINERDIPGWCQGFFGSKSRPEFQLFVGLLNGSNNYGTSVTFPDGRRDICPVIGTWRVDVMGIPMFDDTTLPIVVHEFCHPYVNPRVDEHGSGLDPSAQRIFATCREKMSRMAYTTARIIMYETIVRASVIRYLRQVDGESAAERESSAQEQRGFSWVPELSRLLATYEADRTTYPDLSSFMPVIAAWFAGYAAALPKPADAGIPRVISVSPTNGARNVDPNRREMVVEFDRPMRPGSWSIVGEPKEMPEFSAPRYDESQTTFTVSVKLEPNKRYYFHLNQGAQQGFKSRDGSALRSYEVTFKTAGR